MSSLKLALALSLVLTINFAHAESKSCLSAAKKGLAANAKGIKESKKAKALFLKVEKSFQVSLSKGCETLEETKIALVKSKTHYKACMKKYESAARKCSARNTRIANKNSDVCESAIEDANKAVDRIDDLLQKLCPKAE